jgi:hypothetical protein
MNELVNFNSELPAHLRGTGTGQNVFANAGGDSGFPVISLKGKNFHITRNGDKQLVTNEHGDPVASIQCVIVGVNPNKSKVFYATAYTEGDNSSPDCYSNDGLRPAADADSPQSKTCAACPKNIWGSAVQNGQKRKACGDSMRLAIAAVDQLNDPMLLRVPAGSLKFLNEYGKKLAKRGTEPAQVVTRVGFDTEANFALKFTPERFVDEAEWAEVQKVIADEKDTIEEITGVSGNITTTTERMAADPTPAPVTKSPKLQEAEEEVAVTPKPQVKVDEPAPEPKVETKSVEDYNDIDAALDDLDFDD